MVLGIHDPSISWLPFGTKNHEMQGHPVQVENSIFLENRTLCSTPLGHYACCPEVVLIVKLYEREGGREGGRRKRKFLSNAFSQNMSYLCQAKCIWSQLE